jgi:hypothetical protein
MGVLLVVCGTKGQETSKPAEGQPPAQVVEQLKQYDPSRDDAPMEPGPRVRRNEADRSRWSSTQLRDALQKLSDEQLDGLLDALPDQHFNSYGEELVLTEIVRRGGPQWEQRLTKRYEAMFAAAKGKEIYNLDSRFLQVEMALRRVQKKEDPLAILVAGPSQIIASISSLPELLVLLINLDADHKPIPLMMGGDSRGTSRHNKWHLHVTDESGRTLPEIVEPDMGGIMQPEVLGYRESVPMRMDVSSYVSIEKPGRYHMLVQFHPTSHIGLMQDTQGLMCVTSMPLEIVVQPITIETTPAEQAKVAGLIRQLPDKGQVHVLGGPYAENSFDFIPKDSPAGQLRAKEWNAVPALIKAVNGKELNPTQRAWAFGLLFGITGQHNPAEPPGAVGEYEYRRGDWPALNVGGKVIHQSRAGSGSMEESAQKELAKTWQAWLDNGVIEMKTAEEPAKK